MFDTNTTAIAKAIPSFSMEALDKLYPKFDALMKLQSDLSTKQVLTGEIAFESERLLPTGGVLSAHYGTTTAVRKYTFAMEGISLGIAAAIAAIVAAVVLMLKKFWDWINGTSSYSGGGGGGGGGESQSLAEKVEKSGKSVEKMQEYYEETQDMIDDVVEVTKEKISEAVSEGIKLDMKPADFNLDAIVDRYLATPAGQHSRLQKILNGDDVEFNQLAHSHDYHKEFQSHTALIISAGYLVTVLDYSGLQKAAGVVRELRHYKRERFQSAVNELENAAAEFQQKYEQDKNLEKFDDPEKFSNLMRTLKEKENTTTPEKLKFRDMLRLASAMYTPYNTGFTNMSRHLQDSIDDIDKIIPKLEDLEKSLKDFSLEDIPEEDRQFVSEELSNVWTFLKFTSSLVQRVITLNSHFIFYVSTSLDKIKRITAVMDPVVKYIEHEQKELVKQGVAIDKSDMMYMQSKVLSGKVTLEL